MTLTDAPLPAPAPTVNGARPDHAPGDREMTMLEHLEELRRRLVAMMLAVVAGVAVAAVPIPGFGSVAWWAMNGLTEQGKASGVHFITIRPGEGFFTFLQVALVIGAALAMPVIIYQLLAFVSPALYDNERKYLYIAVPGVTFSFACGVAFCYFLVLPFATHFLAGFAAGVFDPTWTAEHYLDFVSSFLFWMGVVFELPIAMFFLAKMGVVSVQRLVRFRKYAFVLAFVLGAIITPTPDPINQTIISLPIYFLFEIGILLARFA